MASSMPTVSTGPSKQDAVPVAISKISQKRNAQKNRIEQLFEGRRTFGVKTERAKKTRPVELATLLTPPMKLDDWWLTDVLAKGSYSKMYEGRSNFDGEPYAIKVAKKYRTVDHISHEITILRTLMYPTELPHIPKPVAYSKQIAINYYAMTLLGETLSELKKKCPDDRMDCGTWSRIGLQVLYALKSIHEKGILFRNIRPNKLMMGLDEDEKRWRIVHIIDFKFARQWAYTQDEENKGTMYARPLRKNVRFKGSSDFLSPYAHLGHDLGRKDDLWSLLFTLVDLNGSLPWIGKTDHLVLAKMKTDPEIVLSEMPNTFKRLMDHLIDTRPLQRPNYHMFFNILKEVMVGSGETPASKYTFEDFELVEDELRDRKKGKWEEETGEFFAKDLIKINGPEQCYKKKGEWKQPNVNRFIQAEDLVQEDDNKAYLKVPAEREAEEKAKANDVMLKEKIEKEKNKTRLYYELRPLHGEEKIGFRREGYKLVVEGEMKHEKALRLDEKAERKDDHMDDDSVCERRKRHRNETYDAIPDGKPEDFEVDGKAIVRKIERDDDDDDNSKKEDEKLDN